MSAATYSRSVRNLAEFAHRAGDLYEPGGRVTADEGVLSQKSAQKKRGENYQREVSVACEVQRDGITLKVRGRVDGVDPQAHVVEEFKASRVAVQAARPEHVAQAKLYAALLTAALPEDEKPDAWIVRVIYVHPDALTETTFEETATTDELAAFFEQTVASVFDALCAHHAHRQRLGQWLQSRRFPHAQLRPFQGAMMRRCQTALANGEHLLLEAPTGSGKTLATLYPATERLTEASRIWFLTARTTGQRPAEHALQVMDPARSHLNGIVITAKEKICPVPGQPCDPRVCEYASGHYDRNKAAVQSLLERRQMFRADVEAVAQAHRVCPFELALDTAEWADVVIADYNYLFDPVVRLKRFAQDAQAHLLVDEAHQLAPRVQSMLELKLTRRSVKDAIQLAPSELVAALKSVDRQLLALRRTHLPEKQDSQRLVEAPPQAVIRAAERLVSAASAYALEHDNAELAEPVLACVFALSRWARAEEWLNKAAFAVRVERRGTDIVLQAHCVDAATYIAERFAEYGGHVRLSATVSPDLLYQRQHGEVSDREFARAGSPFASEQIGVFVVPDLPTYWRQRQASVNRLTALAKAVAQTREGRYLICFPSYAYLREFDQAWQSPPDVVWHRQPEAEQENERADYAAKLSRRHAGTAELFGVVLGSLFTESVDLADAPLTGVIVVSPALPPPDLVNEFAAAHFAGEGLDGRLMTYIQPGMSKVVQAAGRLIRGPDDRGIVVLVDNRFVQREYQQFFPALWHPLVTTSEALTADVGKFWQEDVPEVQLEGAR